jgi:hypothetical protein
MDSGEGYIPVWNLMHEVFIPCREIVDKAGREFEDAEKKWLEYAGKLHDNSSVLSAEICTMLMDDMDIKRKALRPYKDEWYRTRYGYGLN